jgi:hypothetical protein
VRPKLEYCVGEILMNKRVSDIPPPAGPYDDIRYLFERMANLLGAAEEFIKPKHAAGGGKEHTEAKVAPPGSEPPAPQDK